MRVAEMGALPKLILGEGPILCTIKPHILPYLNAEQSKHPRLRSLMLRKNITDVQIGDVILEGGNRTTVTKVEVSPDGCKTKTHINGKDCWENFSDVFVQS